jgi:hypothetical protein
LITTNDNVAALRFYQKRGFTLAALHKNALEQSRRLKPQIPLLGLDGIPLRDEIELEIFLMSRILYIVNTVMKKDVTGEQQKGKKWVRFSGYFHGARNLN